MPSHGPLGIVASPGLRVDVLDDHHVGLAQTCQAGTVVGVVSWTLRQGRAEPGMSSSV
jgi:hypothetical protein